MQRVGSPDDGARSRAHSKFFFTLCQQKYGSVRHIPRIRALPGHRTGLEDVELQGEGELVADAGMGRGEVVLLEGVVLEVVQFDGAERACCAPASSRRGAGRGWLGRRNGAAFAADPVAGRAASALVLGLAASDGQEAPAVDPGRRRDAGRRRRIVGKRSMCKATRSVARTPAATAPGPGDDGGHAEAAFVHVASCRRARRPLLAPQAGLAAVVGGEDDQRVVCEADCLRGRPAPGRCRRPGARSGPRSSPASRRGPARRCFTFASHSGGGWIGKVRRVVGEVEEERLLARLRRGSSQVLDGPVGEQVGGVALRVDRLRRCGACSCCRGGRWVR